MAKQLTADDAKQSLTSHVEAKGIEIFVKYGSPLGWAELQRLLADRAFVRYPCEIVFDAAKLLPGECAHAEPRGAEPADGFTLWVHPLFMLQLEQVSWLALYQLVAVNYGEFASADEAETFGAAALGLTRDEYYAALCDFADQLSGEDAAVAPAGETPHSCGGGCSCGH